MAFIKDKTDLFGEISATKALFDNFPELNKTINSYESVKSKSGNLIPLFLDLLQELIGTVIEEKFKEFIKKADNIELKIKDVIIKEVMKKVKKSNFKLSDIENPVIKTNIKNIDVDGTLKMDPETEIGKFYYGKAAPQAPALPNDPSVQVSLEPGGDFQKFLFDTKQTGSGNWKNILNVSWEEDDLKVNIDPATLLNNTFENFLRKFLDSIKILDLGKLVGDILDMCFGTISSLTDAGQEWLENKFKLKELCDKVIDAEGKSDNNLDPVIYDNSFFVFSQKERDNIRYLTNNTTNGGNLADLGCGTASTSVGLEDFEKVFDLLQNVKPSLVKETLTQSIDGLMSKSVAGVEEENQESVLANLFTQIWEYLTSTIMSQTVKPWNVMLQQMAEGILDTAGVDPSAPIGAPGINIDNSSLEKSSVEDYFVKFKSLNVCLIKEIQSTIIEYLFDIVKAELIKLVAIKVAQIQADQYKNYKEQIDSAREVLKSVNNIFSLINNLGG